MIRFLDFFKSSVLKSFLNLIYPPLCLHCRNVLAENAPIFCANCLSELELINPQERCPFCFSSDYTKGYPCCSTCYHKKPFLNRIASSFDYFGPASTLVRQMKYGQKPYLAKGAGAFLAAQFLQLGWPQPDCIVPVPIPFTRWIERGYNQSQLLAKTLSQILSCPMQDILTRGSGVPSQAGLNLEQRQLLQANVFQLKKKHMLHDKCVLIVDDVLTTGSTLKRCAEAISEDCPKSIYGLTLCGAIK